VSFNAWFTAFVAGNANAERLADAACGRATGLRSARGSRPTREQPELPAGTVIHAAIRDPAGTDSKVYDAEADAEFTRGSQAGATSDKYVRDTVYLATVLFLVGISGHFPVRQGRYGLIGMGACSSCSPSCSS